MQLDPHGSTPTYNSTRSADFSRIQIAVIHKVMHILQLLWVLPLLNNLIILLPANKSIFSAAFKAFVFKPVIQNSAVSFCVKLRFYLSSVMRHKHESTTMCSNSIPTVGFISPSITCSLQKKHTKNSEENPILSKLWYWEIEIWNKEKQNVSVMYTYIEPLLPFLLYTLCH